MPRLVAGVRDIDELGGWTELDILWEDSEKPITALRVPADFVPEIARNAGMSFFLTPTPADPQKDKVLIDRLRAVAQKEGEVRCPRCGKTVSPSTWDRYGCSHCGNASDEIIPQY